MMSDEQMAHSSRRSTEFNVGEQVPGTPYLVVSRIGQGGMGSVYEVEHRELGKRFVLKALLDQFCQRDDLVQRLRNEWRSLGRLEHPNIVSVSDAGVAANGAPFYVMERLYGESLAGALGRLGRLSLLDSMRIAAEVLEGLSAAHEIGIVHRDVKPPNIFITQSGSAKLLDFGIAKLTDGASKELTGRGIAIGTPRYMSPEQAAGEKVDGRADLYAVGLVLFEMVCGNGPFDGCESHEVFLAHITRLPPRLSDLIEGISPELDGLVASLLAKRPQDRPQTAGTAAVALRSMLRTYRSIEHVLDTQAEQFDGVLTPMIQGEFVFPATPGNAAVLGVDSYPVSGSGPTARASQALPHLPGVHRNASSEHFPTPPFGLRGSTPPAPEWGRAVPPSEQGSVQSWDLGVAQAPATRTAHPGPARRAEKTPSGVSRSTSPGALAPVPQVYAPAPRRFPLWAAVGVTFSAVAGAAWLVGNDPPEVPQSKAELPITALQTPLEVQTGAAPAGVLIPKPVTPSAPVQNAIEGTEPKAANGVDPAALANEAASAGKLKPVKLKVKPREAEASTAREPATNVAERLPVLRPTAERETATAVQKPHTPATMNTELSNKAPAPAKKTPRLPSSGIGGL